MDDQLSAIVRADEVRWQNILTWAEGEKEKKREGGAWEWTITPMSPEFAPHLGDTPIKKMVDEAVFYDPIAGTGRWRLPYDGNGVAVGWYGVVLSLVLSADPSDPCNYLPRWVPAQEQEAVPPSMVMGDIWADVKGRYAWADPLPGPGEREQADIASPAPSVVVPTVAISPAQDDDVDMQTLMDSLSDLDDSLDSLSASEKSELIDAIQGMISGVPLPVPEEAEEDSKREVDNLPPSFFAPPADGDWV